MSDPDSPKPKPSEKSKHSRKAEIRKPFDEIRWRNVCDAIAEDIARDAERIERGEPPLVVKGRLTKAEQKAALRTLNEARGWAGLPPQSDGKKADSPAWTKKAGKASAKIVPIDKPKER